MPITCTAVVRAAIGLSLLCLVDISSLGIAERATHFTADGACDLFVLQSAVHQVVATAPQAAVSCMCPECVTSLAEPDTGASL